MTLLQGEGGAVFWLLGPTLMIAVLVVLAFALNEVLRAVLWIHDRRHR